MCFDPVHGHTVMVGGYGAIGAFSETWTWDGVAWVNRGVTLPSPQFALAYHASTQDLLLHAGGMFRWTGQVWQPVGSGSYGNGGRIAMGYDPVRDETVLWSPSAPTTVGVWNGAVLQARAVAVAPFLGSSVYWHEIAWDAASQRLVLAIAYGGNQSRFYEWSGFGWNQRFPATLPPGGLHALSSDPGRQRVIALDADYQSLQPNHAWSYADAACSPFVVAVEPTLRSSSAMAYDSIRDVHVMFGGLNALPMGDTWELRLGAYASFVPYGEGCAGSAGAPTVAAVPGALPRLGGVFRAQLAHLPPNNPAFLLLGVTDTAFAGLPLPFDLTALQAPGCRLLTSVEDLRVLGPTTGAASWSFPIPPAPGARFFVQAVAFDPVANPLGLSFSNGGRAVVGL